MATVKETFQIDEDKLVENTEKSDYWESCHKFYHQVKDYELERLTEKQTIWLEKIEDALQRG